MRPEFSAMKDFFKKKPDKSATPTKTIEKPTTSELSEEENKRLIGTLTAARAKEDAGDLAGAYALYEQYRRDFKTIKGETLKFELPELTSLTTHLHKRFVDAGIPMTAPDVPTIESLKTEHIKSLEGVFGEDNLEAAFVPHPEQLTDSYFNVMNPAKQQKKDTAAGLTSYRPSWWTEDVNHDVIGLAAETWGAAYLRSMRREAADLQDTIIFSETIAKPNYHSGEQFYGTQEGEDSTKDALLPIIREVFGTKANRFILSWDQINEKLIPAVTKAIQAKLRSTGKAPLPNFEVILTPALASNLSMTLKHPENSQTNTYEWTSTPLLKQDGTDSGNRLFVGFSGNGGASSVDYNHRDNSAGGIGFRLSVVFRP